MNYIKNMDQNSYQPYDVYTRPTVKKNAAYYRSEARSLLKSCYGWALLAALLAMLLGGVTMSAGSSSNFGSDSESETEIALPIDGFMEVLSEDGLGAAMAAYPAVPVVIGAFVAVILFVILFTLFVSSPVMVGYQRYNLDVVDGKGNKIDSLFAYFKRSYAKTIGLNVLHGLILSACSLPLIGTCVYLLIANQEALIRLMGSRGTKDDLFAFNVMVLLIVLVALATSVLQLWVQYRYAFCFMILAEYPEMRVIDALRNSASLMRGNKWRFFCLQFSFIGWNILASLTGIGMIFLMPYLQAAYAVFYDDVANRATARETEFPSLNPDDYNPDFTKW